MMKSTLTKWIVSGSLILFCLPTYASWECYVVDRKGHYWSGTGSTKDRAIGVAKNFCSSFSPNGKCHTSKCIEN